MNHVQKVSDCAYRSLRAPSLPVYLVGIALKENTIKALMK